MPQIFCLIANQYHRRPLHLTFISTFTRPLAPLLEDHLIFTPRLPHYCSRPNAALPILFLSSSVGLSKIKSLKHPNSFFGVTLLSSTIHIHQICCIHAHKSENGKTASLRFTKVFILIIANLILKMLNNKRDLSSLDLGICQRQYLLRQYNLKKKKLRMDN